MAHNDNTAQQTSFQIRKQTLTDYFLEWRRGRWLSYNPSERQTQISRTRHPKPGAFKGLVDYFLADPNFRIRRTLRRVVPRPRPIDLQGQQLDTYNQAQNAADRLAERFKPTGITYEGIVGYGGFGVAVRFAMTDAAGDKRSIVVKTDLRLLDSMIKRERDFMILMAGAEHVVQRIVMAAMPIADNQIGIHKILTHISRRIILLLDNLLMAITKRFTRNKQPRGAAVPPALRHAVARNRDFDPDQIASRSRIQSWWPTNSTLEARRLLDLRENVLILEWCKHGDLGQWINKMAERRATERFSEKVLWLILECLWKGSIGLAYPRAFSPFPINPQLQQAPLMSEAVRQVPPDNPMVHFDLDPSNVFVGDFGEDYNVPIAKIADLGLAMQPWEEKIAPRSNTANEQRIWECRVRGKPRYFTPEQTTEAWDYIADLDALKWNARHDTPGNYWSHSNVFQIGAIMFELITLDLIDVPTLPREYAFRIGDENLSGWTNGWRLLTKYDPSWRKQGSTSILLRQTIAWCMEHVPAKRPSLEALGDIIRGQTTREWPEETDARTRHWAMEFFGEPPEATLPTVSRLGIEDPALV